MRIAILGGTGRTGQQLTHKATAAGHQVVVVGRSASARGLPDGATPLALDVLDPSAMARALTGVDAVVSALSIPRTSRSPFAPTVGPLDLHSRATAALIHTAQATGLRRIIKISAQSVGDSAPRAGWGFRALVAMSQLAPAFADHAVADQLLAATDLDWTILRPPALSDGQGPGIHEAGPHVSTWSWSRVATGDLAAWIVTHLDDPATFKQAWSMR